MGFSAPRLIFDFSANDALIISCNGIGAFLDKKSRGASIGSPASLSLLTEREELGFTVVSASSAWRSVAFKVWLCMSSMTASVVMRATENWDQNSGSSNSEEALCQISAEWQICSRNKFYT